MRAAAALPKTLRFFWDKLPESERLNSTIWAEVTREQVDIDEAKLREHFAAKAAVALKAMDKAGRRVLDARRAQLVGVFLHSLQMTIAEADDALEAALHNRAGCRQLADHEMLSMLTLYPTDTEQKHLAAAVRRAQQLTAEEEFLHGMARAPLLNVRLKVARKRSAFAAAERALTHSIDVLADATAEAASSPLLRTILSITLAVGNALNVGTRWGMAKAIKIDNLLQLRGIQATSTVTSGVDTLLHFVAWELMQSRGGGACELRVSEAGCSDQESVDESVGGCEGGPPSAPGSAAANAVGGDVSLQRALRACIKASKGKESNLVGDAAQNHLMVMQSTVELYEATLNELKKAADVAAAKRRGDAAGTSDGRAQEGEDVADAARDVEVSSAMQALLRQLVAEGRQRISHIEARVRAELDAFGDLLAFFYDRPPDIEAPKFFGMLAKFAREFDDALAHLRSADPRSSGSSSSSSSSVAPASCVASPQK